MFLFEGYPSLEDGVVLIHGMSAGDAPALGALASDAEVYRYLPTFLFEQKYPSEEVLRRLDAECLNTHDSVILGVYLKSDPSVLVGLAEMYSHEVERNKASIGYRLRREFRGRGIATRVVALLVSYLVGEAGIRTITAHIIPENTASANVLRKNGFIDKYPGVKEDWGFDSPIACDKFLLKREWIGHPLMAGSGLAGNGLAGLLEEGYALIRGWKGFDNYYSGTGCLNRVGGLTRRFGKTALLVANAAHMGSYVSVVADSLRKAGVSLAGGAVCPGARPNAPREDVLRIATCALEHRPDCIVAVGGGSTIDACKAASVIATLALSRGDDFISGSDIDLLFGTGKVTAALSAAGCSRIPIVAVQTSASSASHLTKYSNITDVSLGQKKLIVDPALVPEYALFDYDVTCSMPERITVDGLLDALAHSFEVFCGASESDYEYKRRIFACTANLVLSCARTVLDDPCDKVAREGLGLASDLGGCAIMTGGTSGGHLTSFSLVDVAGHGTICALMNPYYAVFFNKAIQPQLKVMGRILASYGFMSPDYDALEGRPLAEAVAKGMMAFSKSVGAPVRLADIPGFSRQVHLDRALLAAMDPDLKMKLQNMPVSMTSSDIMPYMRPVLLSAITGDLSLIVEKP